MIIYTTKTALADKKKFHYSKVNRLIKKWDVKICKDQKWHELGYFYINDLIK